LKKINLGQSFLNREPIIGVNFQHNDYVNVISGKHAGNSGSLVTLVKLEPEPLFVLELESGFDVEVSQSEIKNVVL
jgi:hypothetical protein